MGVVIGETTEIGDDVLLYQGVTLGGTGGGKGKRHPTIENHVVIGTGAKVLGNITIGDRSKIGAGSVVVKTVPPHSTVVGVPGRIVAIAGVSVQDEDLLEHGRLPDPVEQALNGLQERIAQLEAEVRALRQQEAARPV
jgi:serine O-acetyltransferase